MVKTIIEDGIEVYKNHFCKHCGKRIPVRESHEKNGIPENIWGHNTCFKKNHEVPNEWRKIISKANSGKHFSPETEFKKGDKGHAERTSKIKKKQYQERPESHPMWIDGCSQESWNAVNDSLSRGFPFPIGLNEPFKNATFHHINKELGMFIPRALHESIRHSVKTGKNLEEINNIAFEWLWAELEHNYEKQEIESQRSLLSF